MDRTKIEYCDATWNPVTGCCHGCEYCYARRIAKRFGDIVADGGSRILHELEYPAQELSSEKGSRILPYPYGFDPTFHKYRLSQPQKWKMPRNIFVCSMADLFGGWVPDHWLDRVFEACGKAPQHRYLFLTKNPERYCKDTGGYGVPLKDNMWYGTSITGKRDAGRSSSLPASANTFVSMEPLLEDIEPQNCSAMFRQAGWFIIGAETGSRKGRAVPEKEWIDGIVDMCRRYGKPVFMKDSLIPIVGEENMIREFPWQQEAKDISVD